VAICRVTLAVCVTAPTVREIVPVHVVPADNPDGSTDTVKYVPVGLAVKLPVGDRVSQLLAAQLCFDICAVALVLVCAVTDSVCEAGAAPPASALNVKAEELSVRDPADPPVTFRVTWKITYPWEESISAVLV
jgi:hypothetical protein